MIRGHGSDRAWEEFGKRDAYFGVLNDTRFRNTGLSQSARAEFFQTGEAHVSAVFGDVRLFAGRDFAPRHAVDFGCGVGRLVIPLARRCEWVTGVDVSPSMLAEARRNCEAASISNVSFALSDDTLSQVQGDFDFVHSYIVLQHIPPARGERIIRALLERVRPHGVAALHLTYDRRASRFRKAVNRMRRSVPLVNGLVNVLQGRAFMYPLMQMHEYDLRRVFAQFEACGFDRCHLRFTDHGGHLGAIVYAHRGA